MRIHFIAFSGASYTGKTTVCNFLERSMRGIGLVVINEHPVDIVTRGVMAFIDPGETDTSDFKLKEYHGKTGREWVIRIVEDVFRKDDRLMLNRLMMERIWWQTRKVPPGMAVYVLIQSIGFPEELAHLRAFPDSSLLHINMEREGYAYLPRDSRKDLGSVADFRMTLPELQAEWESLFRQVAIIA